jgi:hypothetical protein
MRHLLPNISTLLLSDPTLALALALALSLAQNYIVVFHTPYSFKGIGTQILELDFISRFPYLFLVVYIDFTYFSFLFLSTSRGTIYYSCRRNSPTPTKS